MGTKNEILRAIKERIKGILPSGTQVLLFGSRARGDNREGSDWDILILLDKNKIESSDYDTISYPLFELGWGMGK